jgi:hypothetical protein
MDFRISKECDDHHDDTIHCLVATKLDGTLHVTYIVLNHILKYC